MGYITRYRVSTPNDDKTVLNQVVRRVSSSAGYDVLSVAWSTEGRWYEHEKDMRYASQLTPGVLIVLEGRGESEDDVWRKYFLDGRP
jgi:hypothetical protein